ncbi:hypothetical protein F0562_031584 [Nyssa sinensis]|uniref:Dof zinc finger protein n=1 Tax=Nyssa sinensis TaxID=561372 RepID=A0A5J5ATE2_9ASTE|nr:hypothetical protein F0562_031584 [Nyssa sinensis]
MVFSSVQVHLDPPNWQQQPNQQQGGSTQNPQLPPPVPPPRPVGGGGTGFIRPGSTADRARLASLSQPEAALKCPRCESTNTKFCYFNNYSLLQPRHFCKTCRRYWTRGGELRNVPVGGGYRRSKKSKGSRSKSPVTTERQAGSSSTSAVASHNCATNTIGHLLPPPPQLPFFPSLHHLSDYVSGDIGLNFGVIQPPFVATGGGADMEYHIGTSSSGGGPILTARFVEQWRPQQVQQFLFLAGLEPPAGIYQYEGQGVEPPGYVGVATNQLGSRPLDSGITQLATVTEEENQGLNLSRNFSGISGNDQYWTGNTWPDLFGFTSSTSHLL